MLLEAQRKNRDICQPLLNLDAGWGWLINTTPRKLSNQERHDTRCTVLVWTSVKILASPGFESRTIQLVTCRYTGCAIPDLYESTIGAVN